MATSDATRESLLTVDLAVDSVRELNRRLHEAEPPARVRVLHPGGKHSIAVGLDAPSAVAQKSTGRPSVAAKPAV